jgi:3-methylcrotonyl-CoA carboxylase alpha subunit/acetyl-CoA/propionyl-CoA carboxylase biotin carboxyl carrier protein
VNPLFDCLLVANRGEIAVRIMRAARAEGLRTVAVYSDADRGAPHVREADTAVHIGPTPAAESYLSIPALVQAAERTGAQAIHPGYGFLSERAAFAQACRDAGLIFVGPDAEVIELLGRKDAARKIAVAADVPVLPAVEGGEDAELLARSPAEIGFPLLVKAAAGGGGKGMRVVSDAADFAGALKAARRESLAAFGDDTLLVERYVPRGRHIEVQVLADAHGNVLHLFERDCSVQRRHQKVVEEAPAPTISAELRERLTSAAVRLSRHVGYVNAGTVEFLVESGDADERAYFLEMNTRLQVEHPVTEGVTGLDLVRLQLLIAQGLPLPISQQDVTVRGHAIEVRVYAEDADAGFLPQAGRAEVVRWPERARVDAALESGQDVGTSYDPMLAKLIVSGPTREAARRAMIDALDDSAIVGLTTNLGFLRRLVASDAYRNAAIDTAWLDRSPDALPHETPDLALVAAGWVLAGGKTAAPLTADPFGAGDGWRLGGQPAPVVLEIEHRGEPILLHVDRAAGQVSEGERSWRVHQVAQDGERLRLDVDGVLSEVTAVPSVAGGVTLVVHGETMIFAPRDTTATAPQAISDGTVTAPMPGTVRDVSATVGAKVQAGDVLGVMEAMKMELSLRAPFDGVVTDVDAVIGEQVPLGRRLFTVTAGEES